MTRAFILTAAEMRAAEERAIKAGTTVETLMERAGRAAAEAVWRYAGPMPALVLCGPGNNGGDGYVIARELRSRGAEVRVAALGEPQTPAARSAARSWEGTVEPLDQAPAAPLLIDALFGTGLRRALDPKVADTLLRLARGAAVRAAVDLPSGVSTDDGRILAAVPDFDLTITFATLKPAHLLQPAARHMGRIAVADIGVEASSSLHWLTKPSLAAPGPDDHKYSRGYVAVLAGEMPSAAALAATAALRAGAGYVRLIGPTPVRALPQAIVQSSDGVEDARIGALVAGPGLGRGEEAAKLLRRALATEHPLVLDADALVLLDVDALREARHTAILTPHAGEFAKMFGEVGGSKVEQARSAAARSGAVVVYKGADTVIAAPDGHAAIASAPSWLATAGTGDVLAGIIAAMRSRRLGAFDAACAGVWLHTRAAELAGPALIADDLAAQLPRALAECL